MIRKWPSHATVVAYLALGIALGGTSYAAINIPANSVGTRQLRNGAVTGAKLRTHAIDAVNIADHSLTGAQIASSTLGEVPEAAHARSADHAANADQLGGSPASDYRPHCPGPLHLHDGLCFEVGLRSPTPLRDALTACARAGLRLPTAGELALAFDDLDSYQPQEWVADYGPSYGALMQYLNPDGVISLATDDPAKSYAYRCVTSATN